MRYYPEDLSLRGFRIYTALVLLGLIAFPCYQLLQTGGYLFYTTGMDEASHLSFSYAQYIAQNSGRMRFSSNLVTFFHYLGLGGGYINLIFDVVCSLLTLVLTKRIFSRLGYAEPQARAGALLCFLFPLLFTPFNPIVSLLSSLHFDPVVLRWIAMPWNPELPFIRTPEPQMSWLLIAAALSVTAGTRKAPWALLAMSPLVYPFVRLPLIFVGLALLLDKKFPVAVRVGASFIVTALLVAAFLDLQHERSLTKFFIFSRLPLLPFTGVLALILYLIIQHHIPAASRAAVGILVCSTWVPANVQVISGYLVSPVHFENYWGVAVLGILATMGILHRSNDHRGWVGLAMLFFTAFSAASFAFNQRVFTRLNNPQEVIPLLARSSSEVACNDLYLTTYLDMVHPRQPPTAFSWTRTLNLSGDSLYHEYLCDKEALEQSIPEAKQLFEPIFSALDSGFQSRGAGMFMSIGRQPIPFFKPIENSDERRCSPHNLVLVEARSDRNGSTN